jgi:hypothetical protein
MTSRVKPINVDSMDVDDNDDEDDDVVAMVHHHPPLVEDPNKENQMTSTAATNPSQGGGYQIPFVEKYRPRSLDDVLGNEETVLRLRAIAKDGNLPNLILCGPPGTGTCVCIYIYTYCTKEK